MKHDKKQDKTFLEMFNLPDDDSESKYRLTRTQTALIIVALVLVAIIEIMRS